MSESAKLRIWNEAQLEII